MPNPPAHAIAIIPARLASTRFPGKVLASKTGRPLVQHVVDAAKHARCVQRVVVAADDKTIADALAPFNTEVVLTSPDHPNGTSRLAEAARRLDLAPDQIIINAQGDEPELDPDSIDAAVEALIRTGSPMATVAVPFAPGEDPRDPALVKVVRRLDGTALYFSRSLIPFDRDGSAGPDAAPLRHIGLYIYRRAFLDLYATLTPTPLERVESLEQLRAVQHGHPIAVALRPSAHPGIDTPEQYDAFVKRWQCRR